MADQEPKEIIWFFTLARKFPKLIGRLHDGTIIPGGPYTPTQLTVIGSIVGIGWYTRRFWSLGFGIFDIAILLPLAWVVGYAVGAIPLGAHSPFVMATGLGKSLTSSEAGETDGRNIKLKRPHFVGGVNLIGQPDVIPSISTRPVRVKPKPEATKTIKRSVPRKQPVTKAPATQLTPRTGIQHLLSQTTSPSDQAKR